MIKMREIKIKKWEDYLIDMENTSDIGDISKDMYRKLIESVWCGVLGGIEIGRFKSDKELNNFFCNSIDNWIEKLLKKDSGIELELMLEMGEKAFPESWFDLEIIYNY